MNICKYIWLHFYRRQWFNVFNVQEIKHFSDWEGNTNALYLKSLLLISNYLEFPPIKKFSQSKDNFSTRWLVCSLSKIDDTVLELQKLPSSGVVNEATKLKLSSKSFQSVLQKKFMSGKKYETIENLKDTILSVWSQIQQNWTKNLVETMKDSMYKVKLKNKKNEGYIYDCLKSLFLFYNFIKGFELFLHRASKIRWKIIRKWPISIMLFFSE